MSLAATVPLALGMWRQRPSSTPSPGIYEGVCVGRDSSESPPKIFFADPKTMLTELPDTVSLGYPAFVPSLYRHDLSYAYNEHASRASAPHGDSSSRPIANVVVTADDSVSTMASRIHTNETADVYPDIYYMGGITVLMHTPCDVEDNFYYTLTEEGPMLHRTMQRALRSDARGAPPRMSLLLDNRCPHHAYRDEMRDMLIGRDHSVWKVHASSIVCVETLVTPPPAPLNLERSLERYAEHLVRRAQEHQEEERTLRPPPGAPSRRGAAAAPSRRAEAPPQTCSADDVARGEEACAPAAGARDPAEMPLSPPLRVAVIQRTSQERRILNLEKLVATLKRGLASATFDVPTPRAKAFVEQIVHRASVETLYLEGLELWDQILRVRDVDVLIGVTGSGLANLAFLRPGALVLELTSRSYETGHCHTLILRAHGSLLRGVLTYRKSYVKPVAASAYNDASIAARPDILSGHEELVQSETGAMNRDFHALVNATDVLSLLLDELEHRAGSYRR